MSCRMMLEKVQSCTEPVVPLLVLMRTPEREKSVVKIAARQGR